MTYHSVHQNYSTTLQPGDNYYHGTITHYSTQHVLSTTLSAQCTLCHNSQVLNETTGETSYLLTLKILEESAQ